MKTFLKIGALACVAALSLTACGGGGSTGGDAAGSTTIKILAPSYADSTKTDWEAIITEFNKTHPDVKVELQIEGWDDFTSKVQARIQAKDMPDILNDNAFAASADGGLLYPIDEVISDDVLNTIEPALLKNGEGADGTKWAAPDVASVRELTYNTQILADSGVASPPTTWAELEDACAKIKAKFPDIYPYGMPLGKEEAQVESSLFVWGAGANWVDGDNLTATSDGVKEGFAEMKKLIDQGCTQPNAGSTNRQDVVDLFDNGKVAMYNGHSGLFSKTPDTIKYDTAPVFSKNGDPVVVGVTDFILAFDNGDEARKAATKDFLDLFYSDAMYKNWFKPSGLLPVTQNIIKEESAGADPLLAKYYADLPKVKFLPVGNPQWDVLQGALQSSAGKIASGDVDTVLEGVQAEFEAGL